MDSFHVGGMAQHKRGDYPLLLLVGGDKSTQQKDIRKAIALAKSFEE